jgi:hypothetical protein
MKTKALFIIFGIIVLAAGAYVFATGNYTVPGFESAVEAPAVETTQ